MKSNLTLKLDEIGPWSEIKLDILKEYATAYSTILSAQKKPRFYHVYVDAFSGAGVHISKSTGTFVLGSPLNALQVKPPFREYHLIDLDSEKVDALRKNIGDRKDVFLYQGDCNSILLETVFPKTRYEDYRRALCLLDPYGLHLKWKVIETAGRMKSIDMFLNFPIADINRNVLRRDPESARDDDIQRMNSFCGDDSWQQAAYTTNGNLFGYPEKESNETIAQWFRDRLKSEAGFKYVPKPIPMKNTKGDVVYYLFFASQKPVAGEIVADIFKKYQQRGEK